MKVINNKSKIAFLTFGNSANKKYSLFSRNLVIKKRDSIQFNSTQRTAFLKKKIKFNSFYYFCFSKFKNNKEDNDLIKLFDLATSFYKQRMDIIYLFHIFLLIERMVGRKKDTIVNDEDMFFVLNDNQYI